MKLSKDELARLVFDSQGKFDSFSQSLKDDVRGGNLNCWKRKCHENSETQHRPGNVNVMKMNNTQGGNVWRYQAFLAVLEIVLLKTLF